MELGLIVLKQTIVMFLLMALGCGLYRFKIITEAGSKELSKLLITVVIPAAILKSYLVEYSPEKLHDLLYTAFLTVCSLLAAMIAGHLLYGGQRRIENFSTAFSNAGFVGIPLVSAVLGADAVFYVAIFVALLNFLQQTYGVMLMTGQRSAIRPRKALTNPVLLALAAGILLFLLPFRPPALLTECVGYIANLNTPLAMIVLGVYLAQTEIKEIFTDKDMLFLSIVRLLLVPLLTFAILTVLPGSTVLKMVVLIAAAAPVGSNAAVFAQLHGLDYTYAARAVCSSTIYSILTLPILISGASLFWR